MKTFKSYCGGGPFSWITRHYQGLEVLNPSERKNEIIKAIKEINEIGINWDENENKNFMYIDTCIHDAFTDRVIGKKYAWIMESKIIHPFLYKDLEKNLNLYTETFELIFTHDKFLCQLHHKIKFMPANSTWIRDMQIYPKTKLLSMICSDKAWTDGHKFRLKIRDLYMNRADIFGANGIVPKEVGLKDYMFSIAIENMVYPTYFTEKILDCFATGTIPIYWGCRDIGEHFNKDGIIFLDEFMDNDPNNISPELYYSKIGAIKENFELCKKYKYLETHLIKYFPEDKTIETPLSLPRKIKNALPKIRNFK